MLKRTILMLLIGLSSSISMKLEAHDTSSNDVIYISYVNLLGNNKSAFVNDYVDKVSQALSKYDLELEFVDTGDYDRQFAVIRFYPSDALEERIEIYPKTQISELTSLSPILFTGLVYHQTIVDMSVSSNYSLDMTTALLLYTSGHCDLALPIFSSLMQKVTDIEPVYLGYYGGNCAVIEAKYDEAITLYNFGLFSPHNTPNTTVATNLAWTYIQTGSTDKGIGLIDDLIENCGNDPCPGIYRRYLTRAQLYALVNEYDNAIADFTIVIEHETYPPELTMLNVMRGQMYLALYEWDSALADYNTAIELDPEYSDAYYERGVLYYSILQTGVELRTDALADFQKYLELAPEGEKADDAARYVEQIETELEALNG